MNELRASGLAHFSGRRIQLDTPAAAARRRFVAMPAFQL
jgi:hypothetical protein